MPESSLKSASTGSRSQFRDSASHFPSVLAAVHSVSCSPYSSNRIQKERKAYSCDAQSYPNPGPSASKARQELHSYPRSSSISARTAACSCQPTAESSVFSQLLAAPYGRFKAADSGESETGSAVFPYLGLRILFVSTSGSALQLFQKKSKAEEVHRLLHSGNAKLHVEDIFYPREH